MEKKLNLEAVDALMFAALTRAGFDAEQAHIPDSEDVVLEYLCDPEVDRTLGSDGSRHISAGFRAGFRLCHRVMSDPIRVDIDAIARDLDEARELLDKMRSEYTKTNLPKLHKGPKAVA